MEYTNSDVVKSILLELVGGSYSLSWGLRNVNEKRLIENTPVSKVRSAAVGVVELSGVARCQKIEKSPLSNRECCWWHCRVVELRSDGNSLKGATIKQVSSDELFYLEDTSGRVLINPAGAELRVLNNTFDVTPENASQFTPLIERWGINGQNHLGAEIRLQMTEQVILDGDPLFVMGELSEGSMVVKAPLRGPFVISTQSEQDLLKHFKWRGPLAILGGITFSTFGAWMALLNDWNPLSIVGLIITGFVASLIVKPFHFNFNLGGK